MKITTKKQLLEYIQKEAKRIVSENVDREKEIETALEMAVDPETGKITFNELSDIANQFGLNIEDEVLLGLYQKVSGKATSERQEELKDDIEYTLHEDFNGEFPDGGFQEFYAVFGNCTYDNSYSKKEVYDMYMKLSKDPAQLALFEDRVQSKTHPFASEYDVLCQQLDRLQGEYMDLENLSNTDLSKIKLQKEIEAKESEIHRYERGDVKYKTEGGLSENDHIAPAQQAFNERLASVFNKGDKFSVNGFVMLKGVDPGEYEVVGSDADTTTFVNLRKPGKKFKFYKKYLLSFLDNKGGNTILAQNFDPNPRVSKIMKNSDPDIYGKDLDETMEVTPTGELKDNTQTSNLQLKNSLECCKQK